jgi:MFS family permease
VFSALTAVANGFGSLFGYRLGLGIGESAAYPANAKVVSLWFRGRSARWLPASTTVTTGSGPVARGQPRGPRSSGKQPDG